MGWRPGRLLRALLHWTAVTTVFFWLPLVRCLFDGSTYEWGLFGLGGAGTGGDLWFLALGTSFAAVLLWTGWRGARAGFHVLLLGWHLFLAGGATYLALTLPPDAFTFTGDTLGVEVSLTILAPLLFGAGAIGAMVWTVRDLRSDRSRVTPPWGPTNRLLAGCFAALLPIQFLLLRFGEPHGRTDEIGVLITLVQWIFVGAVLRPRNGA